MIQTDRLILRTARQQDLEPLHAVFTEPRAMRFWDRPPHQDVAQTQRFLDHFIAADLTHREEYILEFEGRCVGKAGMWKRYEIGYILHPDFWGRGLVTEALSILIPRAFKRFRKTDKLTAEVDPRNLASIKVLEKQGFERVGFAEKNFLYGETEWCDTAYYALKRP